MYSSLQWFLIIAQGIQRSNGVRKRENRRKSDEPNAQTLKQKYDTLHNNNALLERKVR
jgi:hypothetical protein